MAPRKVRKRPSQKKVKGTATNAVDDTTAVGDVGAVDGPIMPFRSIHGPVDGQTWPITSFTSIHGHRIWVDRSSSIVPNTAVDISKPRANSIPTAELNDMVESSFWPNWTPPHQVPAGGMYSFGASRPTAMNRIPGLACGNHFAQQ